METVSLPLVSRFMLDMSRRSGIRSELHVRAGDSSSHLLEIVPVYDGKVLSVSDNAVVTFYAERPDGTVIFSDCGIDDDGTLITHTLTSSELSSSGRLSCEIRITSADAVVTSPRFHIIIEDVLCDTDAIEATDEFSALDTALLRVVDVELGLLSKASKVPGNVTGKLAVLDSVGDLSAADISPDELIEKCDGAEGNIPVLSSDGGLSDSGTALDDIIPKPVITAEVTSYTRKFTTALTDAASVEDGQEMHLYYNGDEDFILTEGLQLVLNGEDGVLVPKTNIVTKLDYLLIYPGCFVRLIFKDGSWYFKDDLIASNIFFNNSDTFITDCNIQGAIEEMCSMMVRTDRFFKHGTNNPTDRTAADFPGQFYTNTANGKLFQCTSSSTSSGITRYNWLQIN